MIQQWVEIIVLIVVDQRPTSVGHSPTDHIVGWDTSFREVELCCERTMR
jgi:hypothetical protein